MATSKLTVKLKTDSGVSSTDLYTKSGGLAVSGQAAGDTVWYRYLSADGTWSSWLTTTGTVPAPGTDGVWTVEIKEVSKSGAIVATKSLTFTLDRVVAAPVVGLQTDSGASASDNITNAGQLKIGAEAGAKIEYSLNGGKTWTTTFAAVEGANTVLVRQTDKAGNVSASTKYSFTLDTKAGAAPTVKLAVDSSDGGTGHAADLVTNNGALAVTGTEAGASLQYSTDGTIWAGAFAAREGANAVWVRQVDVAGNASAATKLAFTLDTIAAPVTVGLQSDTGNGAVGTDGDLITSVAGLAIGGVEAGATVQYSGDGAAWSAAPAAAVEGVNTVWVRQIDVAGNVSAAQKLVYTLDTQAAAPVVGLANDSGTAGDGVTNDATLDVTGIEQGALVQYSADGLTWTDAPVIVAGDNTVLVRQIDAAGNVSQAATVQFTLDTEADAPLVSLANDTGSYDTDGVTSDGSLNVTGIEAGATVLYSLDGVTWNQDLLLQEGDNTVYVEQVDAAGNVSAATGVTVTLDTTGPDAVEDWFATSNDVAVGFTAADLTWNDGDAISGSVELVGIDGVSANGGSIVFNADGSFTYQAAADFVGIDSFGYQLMDGAGNVSTGVVNIDVAAAAGGGDTGGGDTGGGGNGGGGTGGGTGGDPFRTYDAALDQTSDLIRALLATDSGIVVDAASVSLHESGYGATNFYDGSLAPLSIGSGLLITSGTKPGTTNTVEWFGQDNGGAWDPYTGEYLTYNGDADLNTVVNKVFSTTSYDATTLSFSFTVTDPAATSVAFNLVFGSDEYPEWVDQFVDCAIVLVNGVNVALFNHDAMAPLSVIGSNLSAGYFQDNGTGAFPIEYDGISKMLTIVAPIHSGTNTIKIGIGDTGDHIYDSGIFLAGLKAGNLPGSGVLIEDHHATSGDDHITGGSTSDLIQEDSGNNNLNGGCGDDIILGGSGHDVITGGSGGDTLSGGAGADEFDYTSFDDWAANDGFDKITDFTANTLALTNASNTDALNGDVLEFSLASLQQLAGAGWAAELAPAAGRFATLNADYVSGNNDGTADQAHGQFVYDHTTGIVGFDADGTGSAAAVEITLLGSHPDSLAGTAFVIVG